MRLRLLALPLILIGTCSPAAASCDARAELEAAFLKQHANPWRTRILSESDTGVRQEQVFDYQPPDRMHRTVTAGDHTVETIGVGRWAWSTIGGGWNELDAPYARMVWQHIDGVFTPPKAGVAFSCLGDVAYDGKTYRGYKSEPETAQDGSVLARTIYLDPETGLPALNIVALADDSGTPLLKEEHSYPTDIRIEPPIGGRDFGPTP